ncbi:hypothetical protein P4U05_17095 [Bacillus paranthracis]|nr:hypothetical protein [Bacillus paranthracis]ADY20327.1 hypothetical protein YBT020_05405 [Bacillus thuringiensis serovar finitimus YBT-020]MRC72823.1 hypothetical protein [Bacillus thuringiensis]MCR6799394.1 hypothetical protein [Bacillus paranthracis]MEC3358446.1 hypothetical protein [Bacillus paranthracis]MED0785441.1 hypothetical protein [Bacillus paranthracis]
MEENNQDLMEILSDLQSRVSKLEKELETKVSQASLLNNLIQALKIASGRK